MDVMHAEAMAGLGITRDQRSRHHHERGETTSQAVSLSTVHGYKHSYQ